MSFDALKASNLTRRKKEIEIDIDGQKLKFYANEISFMQRLTLGALHSNGGDYFTQLIVYSITDQNGNHMTIDQAKQLDEKYQEQFFLAATEVNKKEEDEKK